MLATPPPSRAARARKVSAVSPASSRRDTASEMTASMECDARRRPAPDERRRALIRGAGMRFISPQRDGRIEPCSILNRTVYDNGTLFDTQEEARCPPPPSP